MKVIVAIDDSPHSRHLVDLISHRHWPKDTQFKVISVLEPWPEEYTEEEWHIVLQDAVKRRKERVEEMCQAAREKISGSVPGSIVHIDMRDGDPRTELIDAAMEWQADKMLLGAHSREICPHNLLGSVSRVVAAHAPCTVEVVRTHLHRQHVAV